VHLINCFHIIHRPLTQPSLVPCFENDLAWIVCAQATALQGEESLCT